MKLQNTYIITKKKKGVKYALFDKLDSHPVFAISQTLKF